MPTKGGYHNGGYRYGHKTTTTYPTTTTRKGGYHSGHKTTKYPTTTTHSGKYRYGHITKKYPTTKYPTTKYPTTHPGGHHKSLCECINPFAGYSHAYRGDPATLCGPKGPGVCYVDCNADCRDIKPTASAPRCASSLACDIGKGTEWQ